MFDFTPEDIVSAFIWYVAFLFSTTCHEASHALAAKLQGDETAARGGQVTLNPLPHIQREPWGMVVFPILTVLISHGSSLLGWASAPFDPEWEWRHPRKSALMAMAGPAANFTLMFLAVIGIQVGRRFEWFHGEGGAFGFKVLLVMFLLNLLLGLFNLVPVPPLDGSSAIMVFMKDSTARRYLDWLRGGSFGFMGLVVAALIFQKIYPPIEQIVADILLRHRYF